MRSLMIPERQAAGRIGRRGVRNAARLLAALTLSLVAGACGGGVSTPVARLKVEPAEVTLPYPGTAELEATWEPLAPLAGLTGPAPTVFVHLLAEDGQVVRTFDHLFPGAWEPGEGRTSTLELWQSALAPPVPAGTYRLTAGLYSPETDRWALETSGEEVGRHEYVVARVRVPPAPQGGPDVRFTGSWRRLVMTPDRQVIARRWLGAEGGLVLEGMEAPLRLGLGLWLPEPEEVDLRLVLEEGASEPAVTVRSPCSAEAPVLSRPGFHRVELVLDPGAEGGDCPVELDPNFVLLELSSLERFTLDLRRVTWQPAGG